MGVGILALLLCGATGAFAQSTRTWVSGLGDDANPCSRTAPCKTFAGAISKTAAGGEIDALDDAGYGALTITKSITVDGGGHLAGVLVSGSNGFLISAGASDVVTLRGLQFNGAGTGLVGVKITGAKHVNIENSTIFGFSSNGVENSSTAMVQITNTSIHNNVGHGVAMLAGKATIFFSQIIGNNIGVQSSGASVTLLSNCNISFNATGLETNGTAVLQVTHNDVFENTVRAWNITGGQIQTYVDNRIRGTGVGTLTPVTTP